MTLQPMLIPCKGAAVDLTLTVDPKNPERLQLFWGTALLQVVPRDKNSLLFRVVAGMLTELGLKMSSLEECFGITSKTLHRWSNALCGGEWDSLADVFHGPGAEKKLRPDIERYVRKRYREVQGQFCDQRVPYGFREEVLAELQHYWELEVCGETLRCVFRDEDARLAATCELASEQSTSVGASSASESEENTCSHQQASALGEAQVSDEEHAIAETDREEGCACSHSTRTDSDQTRNNAPDYATTQVPEGCCSVPVLSTSWPTGAMLSQHAGLLMLSPWFDEVFGSTPRIAQQTAAQILLGAVNQEQSKHIDYSGLEMLVKGPVRDITYQHELLGQHLDDQLLMEIFGQNAKLLNLQQQRNFYVDPHHKHYTGMEKILYAWSGKHHDCRKGILMDFIHTQSGAPCFIGHFDNYYDARDRFVLLVDTFRELFGEDAEGFVWINDRGYWSHDFLTRIAENRNSYIQWEKGYKNDAWADACQHRGRFTIVRKRNNRSDKIKVRISWREQTWAKVPGARRLIVRIRRSGSEMIEVAIVSNESLMSAEQIIRLMLNRWLQENDFTYLTRHFGIDELGGRSFDSYAEIADELEDRQVESRDHKRASKKRKALRDKLGRQLITLQGMPAISLEQLDKNREKLRNKLAEQSAKLAQIESTETPMKMLQRIGAQVQKISGKVGTHHENKRKAEKRAEVEAEKEILSKELSDLEIRIREMNRTESRLLALIEEKYVRPDLRKKALLDAIRITCRNVFRQAFEVFRPIYADYRDDHAVLRQLSRASGILVKHPDRIDIYLTPALHRQPAQWERIRSFLGIGTHRIRKRFGVHVRFLLGKTDQQIFHAIARAA